MPTPLVKAVGPFLKPYVDLLAFTGESYYFRKASTSLLEADGSKRNWHPKIAHTMLRDFHAAKERIMYVALPKSAILVDLKDHDLLYVGCSASGGSRYWRGRPTESTQFPQSKSCFHHEQMRRGRDGHSLEHFLKLEPIRVYTMTDIDVLMFCAKHGIVLPAGKYPAHQLERLILSEGFKNWKWNRRR